MADANKKVPEESTADDYISNALDTLKMTTSKQYVELIQDTVGATDPNGKDQHTAGAKCDAGKNRMGLVLKGFSRAVQDMCQVGTFGAAKYTPEGWKDVPDGEARYMDALLRHLFAHMSGELKDSDSGLPHLAHAAWNVLAIAELGKINKEDNNEEA